MASKYRRSVQEERIEIEGIPARLYAARHAPALLLLGHGGAHSKDGPRFVRLCRTYAEHTGLAVVCIDAVDHGERKRPSVSADIPKQWHSSNVDQMVDDWLTISTALSSIGPAVAYVGFSMGAIFGIPTVAAMPSIRAAVFVAGGIPTGGGIDDAPLRTLLLDAAGRVAHAEILMINKTDDPIFSVQDSLTLFDSIPGDRKLLTLSEGEHDDWPDHLIDDSITFVRQHAQPEA